ncbi:hypothetical protein CROQUDRAFT_96548 [Cronartium quercuum f. sp. fusiforme G11]|uniref:Uncharacterized protein n=1 Tax=Cronartium quercuum f. sp. fusiforme G11 TaxID=708437 RepID=A0A9P6NCW5_9BASI|nr:hypothetical protein CROQUDRAFT_96548 [Cronartium quercuum f. sp. fusiforme G11]
MDTTPTPDRAAFSFPKSVEPTMIPLPSTPPSVSNRSMTPISPISSAHSHSRSSTTLADRRKTQASRYLTSEDFKSDFAIKLQTLRQREREPIDSNNQLNSSSPSSNSSTPSSRSLAALRVLTHEKKTPPRDSVTTLATSQHPPSWPSNLSPPITLKSDLDHTSSTPEPTTTIPDISVGLSLNQIGSILGPQDPTKNIEHDNLVTRHEAFNDPPDESQSGMSEHGDEARYEVIGKLADELAQQLETNDKLSYELGRLKSNHAQLQAEAIENDDEIKILRERLRLLDNHDPIDCEQSRNEIESMNRELAHELAITRRSICRLHLELQASRQAATTSTSQSTPVNSLRSPIIHDQQQVGYDCSSRPTSLPTLSTQFTSYTTKSTSVESLNSPLPTPSLQNSDSIDSLRLKVSQLQLELKDCQESRIATETTLSAFKNLIETKPLINELTSDINTTDPRPTTWGLNNLLSRPIPVSPNNTNATDNNKPNTSFLFTTPWTSLKSKELIKSPPPSSSSLISSFSLYKLFGTDDRKQTISEEEGGGGERQEVVINHKSGDGKEIDQQVTQTHTDTHGLGLQIEPVVNSNPIKSNHEIKT